MFTEKEKREIYWWQDYWNKQIMKELWKYRETHPFCTYDEYIEVLKRNNANN